jgi:hypothetical protein
VIASAATVLDQQVVWARFLYQIKFVILSLPIFIIQ